MPQKSGKYRVFKQRLSEAWNFKAPMLLSVPYYFALTGKLPVGQAIVAIIASYTTIAGIAGFGYFVNDLTDAKQDALAGKPNSISILNLFQKTGILLCILLLALLPWLYLPLTALNAPFLVLQFFLFVFYSVPPFRCKERGFAGIVCDAMYAHVNPAVLAALTFSLIIQQPVSNFTFYLLLLVFWQLLLGVRNILQHQLLDSKHDKKSGVKTFMQSADTQQIKIQIQRLLLPLEVGTFACFIVLLGLTALGWQSMVFCLCAALFQYALMRNTNGLQLPIWQQVTFVANQLGLVWLPLALLITICLSDYEYLLILLPHLLFFTEVRTRSSALIQIPFQFLYYKVPIPTYTLSEIVWELKHKIANKDVVN